MGFILQGEGTFHAATAWSEIRAIPLWFGSVARITGIAIGIFMAGGIIGSVALGWDMRASQGLSTGLLTSGAAVLGLALLFAIMSVPAAAPLLAVWVAVAAAAAGAHLGSGSIGPTATRCNAKRPSNILSIDRYNGWVAVSVPAVPWQADEPREKWRAKRSADRDAPISPHE